MIFDSDRLSHAYIAAGALAHSLAMSAVCSGHGKKPCMDCKHCDKAIRGIHPDIAIISKQDKKREILVDQIRELRKDAIILPNEAEKKAYIIDDAATMNNNAQNALLRVLEDPPSFVVFVLKTSTPDELLPTVRSRCVELIGDKIERTSDDAVLDIAVGFFTALEQGNASLVDFMFKLEKLDKSAFGDFLSVSREHAVKRLKALKHDELALARQAFSRIERLLSKAEDYLSLNISTGNIAALICVNLLKGG